MKKTKAEKIPSKKTVCKEFNCAEEAKTNGFCRLHFLRIVKAKIQGGTLLDSAVNEKAKGERRKGNRFGAMQSDEIMETEPVLATVDSLGNIDADITQLVDVENFDAPGPVDFVKKVKKAA